MIRKFDKIVTALFLIFFVLSLYSGNADAKLGIAGVKITPKVSVTYSYDDNYRFTEKEESAYNVNVNPSIDLRYDEGIAEINFNVRSPYRYFSESTGEKSKFLETYFDGDMTLKLPANMKLMLEDNFVSTKLSPFLTEERFDRTDRSENRFRSNLYIPLGTLFKFNIDYRNENYRYVDNDSGFFPFSLNNRKLDNISMRLAVSPTKDTNLFVRYWYQRNIYKNVRSRGSQARQIHYGIEQAVGDFLRITGQIGTGKRTSQIGTSPEEDTLTWAASAFLTLTQKLSLFYNVNRTVTDTTFENVRSENTRRSLSMFLTLRGRLTQNSDIDLVASKTRNTSGVKRGGDTVFKNITVRLENRIFQRISSEVEYRYGINEFQGGGFSLTSNKRKDKRWSAEGRLTFRISNDMNISASYLHEDRKSFFGNFKRNRISFTYTFEL